jgi:hypothetical protein
MIFRTGQSQDSDAKENPRATIMPQHRVTKYIIS